LLTVGKISLICCGHGVVYIFVVGLVWGYLLVFFGGGCGGFGGEGWPLGLVYLCGK
jgi:hypothetical protein